MLGVAQGILNILKSLDWNSLDVVLDLYGDGNESNEIKKFIAENGISNIKYNLGLVNASDDFNGLKDNIFMLKSMPEEEYLRVRQNGIDLSNSTFNFKNINENLVKELSKLVNE